MTLRFIFRSMVVVLMLAPVWMNAQVLHFKMTDEGYGPAEFTALPSYTQTQTLNTLQIDYVFPGFSKYDMVADDGNAYQLIRMEGFGVSSEPGLPSLPERLDKVAIPDGMQAMVSVQPGRITSYNVCYTKLLRIFGYVLSTVSTAEIIWVVSARSKGAASAGTPMSLQAETVLFKFSTSRSERTRVAPR